MFKFDITINLSPEMDIQSDHLEAYPEKVLLVTVAVEQQAVNVEQVL